MMPERSSYETIANEATSTFAFRSLPDAILIVGGWTTVALFVAYVRGSSDYGETPARTMTAPNAATGAVAVAERRNWCDRRRFGVDLVQLLWAATAIMSGVVLDGLIHISELSGSCNRNMTIDSVLSSGAVFYIAHRRLRRWFVVSATGFDFQVLTVSLITALTTPILQAVIDGLRYHIVGYVVVGREFSSISQRFTLLAVSALCLARLFGVESLQITTAPSSKVHPPTNSLRPNVQTVDPTLSVTTALTNVV